MLIEQEVSGDIEELLSLFQQAPEKTDKAINRAVRKLSRWAERQVYRDLAKRLAITQKTLKNLRRISVRLNKGESNQRYLTLWIGTNQVSVHHLGKARQNNRGVTVGDRRFYRSSFLMQPHNTDQELIWNRSEDWRHKYRKSKVSGRWMWMGLPIVKKTESIQQEAESSLKRLQPDLVRRFTELLHQELNYAFNIES